MRLSALAICTLAMLGSPLTFGEESAATKLLEARSEQLRPQITRVAESAYCATGYSPANISMIVGETGVVIVDTGMLPEHAKTVLTEFRKITDVPVAAIVLTHGHGDHTGGSSAFLQAGRDESTPPIHARRPFNTESEALASRLLTATGRNYYLSVAQELRHQCGPPSR